MVYNSEENNAETVDMTLLCQFGLLSQREVGKKNRFSKGWSLWTISDTSRGFTSSRNTQTSESTSLVQVKTIEKSLRRTSVSIQSRYRTDRVLRNTFVTVFTSKNEVDFQFGYFEMWWTSVECRKSFSKLTAKDASTFRRFFAATSVFPSRFGFVRCNLQQGIQSKDRNRLWNFFEHFWSRESTLGW